jgi:hypothetical protein
VHSFDGLRQPAKRNPGGLSARESRHDLPASVDSSVLLLRFPHTTPFWSGSDSRSCTQRSFAGQLTNNLINHRLQFTRSTAKADGRIFRHRFLSRRSSRGRALAVTRRHRCDGSFTCIPQNISNTHAWIIIVPSRLLDFFEYEPFATTSGNVGISLTHSFFYDC